MNDPLASAAVAQTQVPIVPAAVPRRHYSWYHWRRIGLNVLTISILAHLIFGVLATYLIVQTIQTKRKQNFAGAHPQSPERQHAVEHKVQMQKKQQTMSAPVATKRITTTSNSRVALPAMPAMPQQDSTLTPLAMTGAGGLGSALSLRSGATSSSAPGGGGGLSLFGLSNSSGGLQGTFYDFKMEQNYAPVKVKVDFAKIIRDVATLSAPWRVDARYPHYTSPAKLQARYFIFPAIQDTQAGASFKSPKSGPGSWLAHYKGRFSSSAEGSYRFVGFGDNVMIAKVGDRTVLDASDHGYTGMRREAAGSIAFPNKADTPLFFGQWFNLSPNTPESLEILVGDEGGIFCSGLFVQAKGVAYAQGDRGIPKLPIMALGPLTDADRQLLGKFLPDECLQSTFFRAEAPAPAARFDD